MRDRAVTVRTVHLRIEGLVQGVSYRASARDEALRLGVSGWVRNLANGDVESLASGPPSAVDAYVAWCRVGPEEARVTKVTELEAAPDPTVAGFQVRR
ncbi:MAG: acylphosphatase [Myxococcaceae bacterium]|nr:acylphosphatase [Myxococcaceae bacterium]